MKSPYTDMFSTHNVGMQVPYSVCQDKDMKIKKNVLKTSKYNCFKYFKIQKCAVTIEKSIFLWYKILKNFIFI